MKDNIYKAVKKFENVGESAIHSTASTGIYQHLIDETNMVLAYHSVGGTGWGNITETTFREHIEFLSNNYNIVDLPKITNESKNKSISLTFDDAYKSFYTSVWPILKEYNVPATVFVIGETINSGNWHKTRNYVSKNDLLDLAKCPLVTIGSHTMSHPNLGFVTNESTAKYEILHSKNYISQELDLSVDRFAYPYGKYNNYTQKIAEDNYDIVVTMDGMCERINHSTSMVRIPRIESGVNCSALKYRVSDVGNIVGVPKISRKVKQIYNNSTNIEK